MELEEFECVLYERVQVVNIMTKKQAKYPVCFYTDYINSLAPLQCLLCSEISSLGICWLRLRPGIYRYVTLAALAGLLGRLTSPFISIYMLAPYHIFLIVQLHPFHNSFSFLGYTVKR